MWAEKIPGYKTLSSESQNIVKIVFNQSNASRELMLANSRLQISDGFLVSSADEWVSISILLTVNVHYWQKKKTSPSLADKHIILF